MNNKCFLIVCLCLLFFAVGTKAYCDETLHYVTYVDNHLIESPIKACSSYTLVTKETTKYYADGQELVRRSYSVKKNTGELIISNAMEINPFVSQSGECYFDVKTDMVNKVIYDGEGNVVFGVNQKQSVIKQLKNIFHI